ncbi:Calcium-dependent protein kinase 13 [Apostasia shenzhenica]|uniref:Calcium-dependent protein kinase 13 n=1 Tax=Apostasia shenzhenica TaxID=1088818 RepID=A0A2I0B677_9ASPA|nr:Calcium-dependent protein kinase 13 [Apostasia shenzhenica]
MSSRLNRVIKPRPEEAPGPHSSREPLRSRREGCAKRHQGGRWRPAIIADLFLSNEEVEDMKEKLKMIDTDDDDIVSCLDLKNRLAKFSPLVVESEVQVHIEVVSLLILTLSLHLHDGRISYDNFIAIMKTERDWRIASRNECISVKVFLSVNGVQRLEYGFHAFLFQCFWASVLAKMPRGRGGRGTSSRGQGNSSRGHGNLGYSDPSATSEDSNVLSLSSFRSEETTDDQRKIETHASHEKQHDDGEDGEGQDEAHPRRGKGCNLGTNILAIPSSVVISVGLATPSLALPTGMTLIVSLASG